MYTFSVMEGGDNASRVVGGALGTHLVFARGSFVLDPDKYCRVFRPQSRMLLTIPFILPFAYLAYCGIRVTSPLLSSPAQAHTIMHMFRMAAFSTSSVSLFALVTFLGVNAGHRARRRLPRVWDRPNVLHSDLIRSVSFPQHNHPPVYLRPHEVHLDRRNLVGIVTLRPYSRPSIKKNNSPPNPLAIRPPRGMSGPPPLPS